MSMSRIPKLCCSRQRSMVSVFKTQIYVFALICTILWFHWTPKLRYISHMLCNTIPKLSGNTQHWWSQKNKLLCGRAYIISFLQCGNTRQSIMIFIGRCQKVEKGFLKLFFTLFLSCSFKNNLSLFTNEIALINKEETRCSISSFVVVVVAVVENAAYDH